MRKVEAAKTMEALQNITQEQIEFLTDMLVIQDESSAMENSNLLNLDYAIPKEANTNVSTELPIGHMVIPTAFCADGDDVDFTDGIVGFFLTHFKYKELKEGGVDDKKTVCGTPVLQFKDPERNVLRFYGDNGFKYGKCSECVFGKYDPKATGDKCLPSTKFVMLTAVPDATGEYQPALVQVRGGGIRATTTKNVITKLIAETRGNFSDNLVKLTLNMEKRKTADNQNYVVHQYVLAVAGKVTSSKKETLSNLRNKLIRYYGDQHDMRMALYSNIVVEHPDFSKSAISYNDPEVKVEVVSNNEGPKSNDVMGDVVL